MIKLNTFKNKYNVYHKTDGNKMVSNIPQCYEPITPPHTHARASDMYRLFLTKYISYICLYFNKRSGYWDFRTYKDIKLRNELLTSSGK